MADRAKKKGRWKYKRSWEQNLKEQKGQNLRAF